MFDTKRRTRIIQLGLFLIIITLCLFPAGCSDDTPTTTATQSATPATASTPVTTTPAATTPTTRQVTNQDGTVVTIPAEVVKVACLEGPSFEKVAMLGAADKVVYALDGSSIWTWVPRVIPEWENVNGLPSKECWNPNLEELLEAGIQVIFFWNTPETIQKFEEVGIACIYPGNPESKSGEVMFDDAKNLLRVYAAALGEEAQQKAEAYCTYFDQKKALVAARTADIPDTERPTVYFAYRKSLATIGKDCSVPEIVSIAGGQCVSSELEGGTGCDIVIEQLLEWDPEYIILEHCGSKTLGSAPAEEIMADIAEDSRFDSITAIKNGDVYVCPTGIYFWDDGQQMILQLLWLAKLLHPDKFQDIDMIQEIKYYYSEFYNCQLTDHEAELILMHMPYE